MNIAELRKLTDNSKEKMEQEKIRLKSAEDENERFRMETQKNAAAVEFKGALKLAKQAAAEANNSVEIMEIDYWVDVFSGTKTMDNPDLNLKTDTGLMISFLITMLKEHGFNVNIKYNDGVGIDYWHVLVISW